MCQSVSNEVWLAWFKFQAKILSCFGECQWGWQKYIFPSPPLFKDKGLKDIGHRMSIRNVILVVSGVTVRCLIRYDTLLRNVTDIIKNTTAILFDMWPLLQIATILLQNATVITKFNVYYKSGQYNEPASLPFEEKVLLTDFISSIK